MQQPESTSAPVSQVRGCIVTFQRLYGRSGWVVIFSSSSATDSESVSNAIHWDKMHIICVRGLHRKGDWRKRNLARIQISFFLLFFLTSAPEKSWKSEPESHMEHFPQDRENEQDVAFFKFLKLYCDQTVNFFQIFSTIFNALVRPNLQRWTGFAHNFEG